MSGKMSLETDLKSKIDDALVRNGDVERLKGLLKTRLEESGWRDEVKLRCLNIIREEGLENIDLETLVKEVTPYAREQIHAGIKKELLQRINTAAQKYLDSVEKTGNE